MIFQNYLIKRRIKTVLNNASARKSRFCSLNDAKTFLISFNVCDKEEVLKCIERLKELNKEIRLSIFIPRKQNKVKHEIDDSWLVVKEKDLDAKGAPSPDMREAFENTEADILIDLTRKDDYIMHYLQLRHPALFKVGNKSSLRHLFDLTVTMKEEDAIPHFFEYILFYLRTIRSN